MRGHVDAESLALYAEGQLGRRQTARVRAHLSSCPECAGTVAALTDVTTQLSHVPAPPMPSTVLARLDAALSAEAAGRAAGPAPAPAPRPPRRNPLWSPRALRILAATGVTLVVAGGVGYAVSQSGSSGPGTSGAAAPASGAQRRPAVQGGPNLSPRSPGGHHSLPNIAAPSTRYVASGTHYRDATLRQQTKRVLAEYDVPGISGPHILGSADLQVRGCVSRVAGSHKVPVVDLARYQDRPAIVIMLASATGKPESVTVVTPHCSRLASATLSATSGPATG